MPKRQYEPSTQEWFNQFLHGKISPTDAVLSPVERRILPSFNSPFHASNQYPSWIHSDCGLELEYSKSFGGHEKEKGSHEKSLTIPATTTSNNFVNQYFISPIVSTFERMGIPVSSNSFFLSPSVFVPTNWFSSSSSSSSSSSYHHRLSWWLRTEPTLNSNGKKSKQMMKIGAGSNWWLGVMKDDTSADSMKNNKKEGSESENKIRNETSSLSSSSLLRTGCFVDLSQGNTKLNDWYAGGCFVRNPPSPSSSSSSTGSGGKKWQIAFHTCSHYSSKQQQPNSSPQRSALAFVHWNWAIPWWLRGGGGNADENINPPASSASSSSWWSFFPSSSTKSKDKTAQTSSSNTSIHNHQVLDDTSLLQDKTSIVASGDYEENATTMDQKKQQQNQSEEAKQKQQEASSKSSSPPSVASSSASSLKPSSSSSSPSSSSRHLPPPPEISWYASASYQQDPSFIMIRFNASFPISPFSEISMGSDPLRRFHAALCTQVNRYIDAGMRVRLNTISWQDAGLDVGAMINLSSILRGGRPKRADDPSPSIRVGVQSAVGENLHIFADIFRTSEDSTSVAIRASSASSSWGLTSFVKSFQIGLGFSKLNGSGGDLASGRFLGKIGMDTFIKMEF